MGEKKASGRENELGGKNGFSPLLHSSPFAFESRVVTDTRSRKRREVFIAERQFNNDEIYFVHATYTLLLGYILRRPLRNPQYSLI